LKTHSHLCHELSHLKKKKKKKGGGKKKRRDRRPPFPRLGLTTGTGGISIKEGGKRREKEKKRGGGEGEKQLSFPR